MSQRQRLIRVREIEKTIGSLQKNFECPVCLDLMKTPVSTKCDHTFCQHCIHKTLGKKARAPCPLCKEMFTKRSLIVLPEWEKIVKTVAGLARAFQMDTGGLLSSPVHSSAPQPASLPSTSGATAAAAAAAAPPGEEQQNKDTTVVREVNQDESADVQVDEDTTETILRRSSRPKKKLKRSFKSQKPKNTRQAKGNDDVWETPAEGPTDELLAYLADGSLGGLGTQPTACNTEYPATESTVTCTEATPDGTADDRLKIQKRSSRSRSRSQKQSAEDENEETTTTTESDKDHPPVEAPEENPDVDDFEEGAEDGFPHIKPAVKQKIDKWFNEQETPSTMAPTTLDHSQQDSTMPEATDVHESIDVEDEAMCMVNVLRPSKHHDASEDSEEDYLVTGRVVSGEGTRGINGVRRHTKRVRQANNTKKDSESRLEASGEARVKHFPGTEGTQPRVKAKKSKALTIPEKKNIQEEMPHKVKVTKTKAARGKVKESIDEVSEVVKVNKTRTSMDKQENNREPHEEEPNEVELKKSRKTLTSTKEIEEDKDEAHDMAKGKHARKTTSTPERKVNQDKSQDELKFKQTRKAMTTPEELDPSDDVPDVVTVKQSRRTINTSEKLDEALDKRSPDEGIRIKPKTRPPRSKSRTQATFQPGDRYEFDPVLFDLSQKTEYKKISPGDNAGEEQPTESTKPAPSDQHDPQESMLKPVTRTYGKKITPSKTRRSIEEASFSKAKTPPKTSTKIFVARGKKTPVREKVQVVEGPQSPNDPYAFKVSQPSKEKESKKTRRKSRKAEKVEIEFMEIETTKKGKKRSEEGNAPGPKQPNPSGNETDAESQAELDSLIEKISEAEEYELMFSQQVRDMAENAKELEQTPGEMRDELDYFDQIEIPDNSPKKKPRRSRSLRSRNKADSKSSIEQEEPSAIHQAEIMDEEENKQETEECSVAVKDPSLEPLGTNNMEDEGQELDVELQVNKSGQLMDNRDENMAQKTTDLNHKPDNQFTNPLTEETISIIGPTQSQEEFHNNLVTNHIPTDKNITSMKPKSDSALLQDAEIKPDRSSPRCENDASSNNRKVSENGDEVVCNVSKDNTHNKSARKKLILEQSLHEKLKLSKSQGPDDWTTVKGMEQELVSPKRVLDLKRKSSEGDSNRRSLRTKKGRQTYAENDVEVVITSVNTQEEIPADIIEIDPAPLPVPAASCPSDINNEVEPTKPEPKKQKKSRTKKQKDRGSRVNDQSQVTRMDGNDLTVDQYTLKEPTEEQPVPVLCSNDAESKTVNCDISKTAPCRDPETPSHLTTDVISHGNNSPGDEDRILENETIVPDIEIVEEEKEIGCHNGNKEEDEEVMLIEDQEFIHYCENDQENKETDSAVRSQEQEFPLHPSSPGKPSTFPSPLTKGKPSTSPEHAAAYPPSPNAHENRSELEIDDIIPARIVRSNRKTFSLNPRSPLTKKKKLNSQDQSVEDNSLQVAAALLLTSESLADDPLLKANDETEEVNCENDAEADNVHVGKELQQKDVLKKEERKHEFLYSSDNVCEVDEGTHQLPDGLNTVESKVEKSSEACTDENNLNNQYKSDGVSNLEPWSSQNSRNKKKRNLKVETTLQVVDKSQQGEGEPSPVTVIPDSAEVVDAVVALKRVSQTLSPGTSQSRQRKGRRKHLASPSAVQMLSDDPAEYASPDVIVNKDREESDRTLQASISVPPLSDLDLNVKSNELKAGKKRKGGRVLEKIGSSPVASPVKQRSKAASQPKTREVEISSDDDDEEEEDVPKKSATPKKTGRRAVRGIAMQQSPNTRAEIARLSEKFGRVSPEEYIISSDNQGNNDVNNEVTINEQDEEVSSTPLKNTFKQPTASKSLNPETPESLVSPRSRLRKSPRRSASSKRPMCLVEETPAVQRNWRNLSETPLQEEVGVTFIAETPYLQNDSESLYQDEGELTEKSGTQASESILLPPTPKSDLGKPRSTRLTHSARKSMLSTSKHGGNKASPPRLNLSPEKEELDDQEEATVQDLDVKDEPQSPQTEYIDEEGRTVYRAFPTDENHPVEIEDRDFDSKEEMDKVLRNIAEDEALCEKIAQKVKRESQEKIRAGSLPQSPTGDDNKDEREDSDDDDLILPSLEPRARRTPLRSRRKQLQEPVVTSSCDEELTIVKDTPNERPLSSSSDSHCELAVLSEAFGRLHNFPEVVGCIDGTHIPIHRPSAHEAVHVCRHGYHSMNVLDEEVKGPRRKSVKNRIEDDLSDDEGEIDSDNSRSFNLTNLTSSSVHSSQSEFYGAENEEELRDDVNNLASQIRKVKAELRAKAEPGMDGCKVEEEEEEADREDKYSEVSHSVYRETNASATGGTTGYNDEVAEEHGRNYTETGPSQGDVASEELLSAIPDSLTAPEEQVECDRNDKYELGGEPRQTDEHEMDTTHVSNTCPETMKDDGEGMSVDPMQDEATTPVKQDKQHSPPPSPPPPTPPTPKTLKSLKKSVPVVNTKLENLSSTLTKYKRCSNSPTSPGHLKPHPVIKTEEVKSGKRKRKLDMDSAGGNAQKSPRLEESDSSSTAIENKSVAKDRVHHCLPVPGYKAVIKEAQNVCSTSSPLQKSRISPNVSTDCSFSSVDLDLPQRPQWSFVSSGLKGLQPRALVSRFQKAVGAKTSSKMTSTTTHLIVGPAVKATDPLTCERTLKYFQAIAMRKWIVSVRWIQDMRKKGQLLPEEEYEIKGDMTQEVLLGGPRAARLSDSGQLFANMEICCLGKFDNISTDELRGLIEACGGTTVHDPSLFSFLQTRQQVVVVEDNKDTLDMDSLRRLDRKYGMPIVPKDWVLDSIGAYKCNPLEDAVINLENE